MKITFLSVVGWLALTALSVHPPVLADSMKSLEDSISTSSWSLLLKASAESLVDSLAVFGVRPDATPDYDPAYDTPRPPDPPTDYVKIYFPHSGDGWPPFLGTKWMIDITSPQSPEWFMTVEASVSGLPVSFTWDTSGINLLPKGYSIMAYDSQASVSFSLRSQDSYSFLYSGPRKFFIWIDTGFTRIDLSPRWNLVSLPRYPQNPLKSIIFTNALSDAFYYDDGYIMADSLQAGTGYWVKYDGAESVFLFGLEVQSLSIPLIEGWNLIGTITNDVVAPSGGILSSNFFGYNDGYYSTDTLKPGKGYWIKASSSGILELGSAPVGINLGSRDY